ncbi:branched-chain amino acid ABC transporter permease [Maribrevibacterium harenarium]|uniref:Branched-chain amino acid ABC transporter permease n=1 Tax=Maribrevibacterium harenarium TaxID=2589817 RepID=A0A501X498_9GAMM|nr:branched-chain amino acid ABC transporter permease [Maribrevibacterium harenarium]TPE55342.1 branched-chain amino acid ABC transporter permease [Maribrevibacterium harenarium]
MVKRTTNLVVALALMVAVCAYLAWGKPTNVVGLFVVSGMAVGSLYALGGIGLVVLYRATGVLNLSNGAIGALGVMFAWQLQQWDVPHVATWIVGILTTTALALIYGRLIAPGLAWRDPVVKAVATLGYALIILGMTAFLWEDDVRKFALPSDKIAYMILGMRVTLTRLIVILAAIGIVVAVWFYLSRTRTGLNMRALADNRDISALIGIPIVKTETIAWGISGLIAGFTGLMFGDLVRLEPFVITFMVIPAISAAICGQLKNLGVVLVAGICIGVIESLLTLHPFLKSVRPMAPFVIAILVLVWLQRGRMNYFAGN